MKSLAIPRSIAGRGLCLLLLSASLTGRAIGQRPPAEETPTNRTEAFELLRRAMAASVAGDADGARRQAHQVLDWAKEQSDSLAAAWSQQTIGYVEFSAGRLQPAGQAFREALSGFERSNQPRARQWRAACHANLGRIALNRGQWQDAVTHCRQAIVTFRKLSLATDEAVTLVDLAEAQRAAGQIDEATRSFVRALEIGGSQQLADAALRTRAALGLAECYQEKGAWDQARQVLERVDPPENDSAVRARLANALGILCQKTGRHDQALQQYLGSIKLHSTLKDSVALARVHNNLGTLYRETGRLEEARRELQKALEIQGQAANPDPADEARALYNLALVYEEQNSLDDAVSALERVLAIRRKLNDSEALARTLDNLALLHAGRGDSRKAAACAEEARRLRAGRKD